MGAWSPWDNPNYYWVVICKNDRFHHHTNTMYGHKIPLGETDAFSSLPALTEPFTARCDVCNREYEYKPNEVLRFELNLDRSLVPHPLFDWT